MKHALAVTWRFVQLIGFFCCVYLIEQGAERIIERRMRESALSVELGNSDAARPLWLCGNRLADMCTADQRPGVVASLDQCRARCRGDGGLFDAQHCLLDGDQWGFASGHTRADGHGFTRAVGWCTCEHEANTAALRGDMFDATCDRTSEYTFESWMSKWDSTHEAFQLERLRKQPWCACTRDAGAAL